MVDYGGKAVRYKKIKKEDEDIKGKLRRGAMTPEKPPQKGNQEMKKSED